MFVYRTNGTRFDTNHVQIKDRSVRKSVPVWAWFSASGSDDSVHIRRLRIWYGKSVRSQEKGEKIRDVLVQRNLIPRPQTSPRNILGSPIYSFTIGIQLFMNQMQELLLFDHSQCYFTVLLTFFKELDIHQGWVTSIRDFQYFPSSHLLHCPHLFCYTASLPSKFSNYLDTHLTL